MVPPTVQKTDSARASTDATNALAIIDSWRSESRRSIGANLMGSPGFDVRASASSSSSAAEADCRSGSGSYVPAADPRARPRTHRLHPSIVSLFESFCRSYSSVSCWLRLRPGVVRARALPTFRRVRFAFPHSHSRPHDFLVAFRSTRARAPDRRPRVVHRQDDAGALRPGLPLAPCRHGPASLPRRGTRRTTQDRAAVWSSGGS